MAAFFLVFLVLPLILVGLSVLAWMWIWWAGLIAAFVALAGTTLLIAANW